MGDEDRLEYLSPAWLAALDAAVRADDRLRAASAGADLVIEQVVEVPDGAPVVWHVRLDDGEVAVAPGSAAEPTVRFTTDHRTAEAITRGWEPAQAAFLRGDLRIGGDTAALAAARELLAGLDDATASVRERTDFPSRDPATSAPDPPAAPPPPPPAEATPAPPPPPLPRRGRR